MKYVYRLNHDVVVDAIQFTSIDVLDTQEGQYVTKGLSMRKWPNIGGLLVLVNGKWMGIKPGTWFVRDANDDIWHLTDEVFRDEFVTVQAWASVADEEEVLPLDREDVFTLLSEERDYQDNKWGTIEEHPHELPGWIATMRHYLAKAEALWVENEDQQESTDAIRKAVAVGVACLEQHGCPDRVVDAELVEDDEAS